MTPSQGFTFVGGPNTVRVLPGQRLRIVGQTTLDGKECNVLSIPGESINLLVEKQTGALQAKVLNSAMGSPVVMLWSFKSTPDGINFNSSISETVESSYSYTNYEFIYSGKTGNTINFLYREFTANDLAKPAFFQTVSYESDEKIIEFKSLKLNVISVTSSSISVKVLGL